MKIKRKDLNKLIENYLFETGAKQVPTKSGMKKPEGDKFRKWMSINHPDYKDKRDGKKLASTGTVNSYLDNAWALYAKEYKIDLDKKSGTLDDDGNIKDTKKEKKKNSVSLQTQGIKLAFQTFASLMDPFLNSLGNNWITRIFVQFVKMRTIPMTEKSLTSELADCLRIIALDAAVNKGATEKNVIWGDDADYKRVAESEAYKKRFGESTGNFQMAANMKGKKSITDSLTSKDPLNGIFNSFTHMNIKVDGDTIKITDTYDFNPIVNILGEDDIEGKKAVVDTEFFTKEENFYKFIKNAKNGKLMIYRMEADENGKQKAVWRASSIVSREGIENLCRFYHGLFDYKGVPLDITLNKTSPNKYIAALWDTGAAAYDSTIGGLVNTGRELSKSLYNSIFGDEE